MNLAYRQLAVIAVANFLHLTHYLSRPAFASVGLRESKSPSVKGF